MIIYVVIFVVIIVLTLVTFDTLQGTNDKRKAVLLIICIVVYFGAIAFLKLDKEYCITGFADLIISDFVGE